MTDQWTDRLSEYLDDELTALERQEVEQHLQSCKVCSQVLAELEGVVARAFQLTDREPRADLWPLVRRAIADGRVVNLESRRTPARRFSFSLPQLTAAAAALVLMSAGTAWLATSRDVTNGRDVFSINPDTATPIQTVSNDRPFDPKGRADSAVTELERILAEESSQLDSSTVRILAENLALIDRAIGQARKALESDPNNPYLNDHLARTMRKKIDVLRRAADLAHAES